MLLVFYFRFVNRGKFMDHVQGDKFYKHSIGLENIYIYIYIVVILKYILILKYSIPTVNPE
jgi:hypothetical protein